MAVDWVRATAATPCPVCGRTHYCSVSSDGGLVCCTKVASDRPTSDGAGWLHQLAASTNGHANGHAPPAAVGLRTTRYAIRDVTSDLVAVHVRRDLADGSKRVWWEQPDGTKGLGDRTPSTLPLYRIDTVPMLADPIFVCEGEKAADALASLGLFVVGTVTGAAAIPADQILEDLAGHDVVLWPDNDDAGRRHMSRIAQRLIALDTPCRILTWPDAPAKGDAADFVAAGLGRDELRVLYAEAVPYTTEFIPDDPESGINSDGGSESVADELHLTDMGNAERLVRRHGPDLRFCAAWKRWVVWGGETWAAEGDGLVVERAKETVRSIYEEGVAAPGPERAQALWKHAQRSESAGRVHAMVDLARSAPRLVVAPDDLDRDPMLLNVANGTVDLATGLLRPFCREDLMSKRSPVLYDAAATCPIWLAFLDQVMGGDAAMVAYLQRMAGYCLTGMTVERVLFILFGAGRNGKSTFLEVLRYVLGDYASGTPASTIMSQRNKGIPNDIARLKGARFVSASETSEGAEIDEAFVKVATGGDTITARFLNAEFFDFRPQFKLALATNHKPAIKGTDPAVWDRIHLVPWLVRILDQDVDKGLRDKLIAEADGILQWAIAGCLAWRRIGDLAPPPLVANATNEYRVGEDVFATFVAERCEAGKAFSAVAGDLHAAYADWAAAAGEEKLSQRRLGDQLRAQGFTAGKGTAGRRRWSGVRLLSDAERFAQDGDAS